MGDKQKPEWKAPRGEYGGEDLQEYFAGMLVDETVAMLMRDAIRGNRALLETVFPNSGLQSWV